MWLGLHRSIVPLEATTRIRDLRMQCGDLALSAWPPSWAASRSTSTDSADRHGKLTWVERMPHGIGLWLTRRFDGVAQRGSLLWSGPPSVDELARVLQGQIGQVFRNVGDVELSADPRPDPSVTMAGPAHRS